MAERVRESVERERESTGKYSHIFTERGKKKKKRHLLHSCCHAVLISLLFTNANIRARIHGDAPAVLVPFRLCSDGVDL